MPRTTLNLDPEVLRELRERSARERRSVGEIASQLLARDLNKEAPAAVVGQLESLERPRANS